jgi:hypothetical protein
LDPCSTDGNSGAVPKRASPTKEDGESELPKERILKEKGGSLTQEKAQQAASKIASRFGVFECDRCAREIAKRLGRRSDAIFQRLSTADRSDIIGLADEDKQISASGFHVGVRIGDKVFDNLHHTGVSAHEWADRFVTSTGADLLIESRPIIVFFAKRFLTKKFNRWLGHR